MFLLDRRHRPYVFGGGAQERVTSLGGSAARGPSS